VPLGKTQIGKAQIAAMIPHVGRMCLLDEVERWSDAAIRCISRSHRDADNPLRAGAELPALCGIEYAAQAMAVHGRLSAAVAEKPRAGFIVSVSDVVCRVRRLDDLEHDLVIEAERLAGDGARVLYRFALSAGEREILHGKAAAVLDAGGAGL
jgi:predicted hotdog family 3-hydroxylacyl-ACP dehydratase